MKKLFFIPFIITLSFISCKKPEGDDISGKNEIKGTVYLNDSLNNLSEEIAQKNLIVELKNEADSNTLNYIYSVTSDLYGNFTFTNLSPVKYILYAEKVVNGLLFSARQTITGGIDSAIKLVLYPDVTRYNILSITALDNISKAPLFNTRVCIFNNSTLAKNNLCDGNIFSGTTNQYGKLYTLKLDTGWHFLNAQLVTSGITLNVKDSVLVTSKTGIISKTIFLK